MLKLKKGSMENILKTEKNIVCFGAGALAEFMLQSYSELADRNNLIFIDNNIQKDNTYILTQNRSIPVYSLEHFKNIPTEEFILIIVPVFFYKIIKQLDEDKYFNDVEAYIYPLVSSSKEYMTKYAIRNSNKPDIPKTIHYCWFGKKEIPDKLKCIMSSWKEKCPDYEIVRWDETNYDIKKNRYMYEAYEKGCYEYVSDYARKDILYQHGGIYLDTDVEILKNIDDLRYNEAFVCMDDVCNLGSGAGMGAVSGMPLIKELMDDYQNISFIKADGSINSEPSGVNETRRLLKRGFKQQNKYQKVCDMSVFPREVLLPVSWCGFNDIFTENTYMAHHFQKFIYGYTTQNVSELKACVEEILQRCEQ